jgi:hypothetical protein
MTLTIEEKKLLDKITEIKKKNSSDKRTSTINKIKTTLNKSNIKETTKKRLTKKLEIKEIIDGKKLFEKTKKENEENYKKKKLLKLNNKEYADLKAIIKNQSLTPVIINEESNFVIVTYWWGRNNINLNTQKPCPDEYDEHDEEDNKMRLEPITYEKMIENWKKSCIKANCNYLAVEYPEFAKKGGYQKAINAKPLFIKNALENCNGRNVVYIDGDMTVNNYPDIFDMPNVDYMARGWSTDPRSCGAYLRKTHNICFDPFTFETSGGIMFFANTVISHKLLKMWIDVSHQPQMKGRADDRIISMIILMKNMHLELNMIQLPIEFLWLTDAYSPSKESNNRQYIHSIHYNRDDIMFEHPACITSEDMATNLGAANNRNPPFYEEIFANQMDCEHSGGTFWEYILFNNQKQLKGWDRYLEYLNKVRLYNDEDGKKITPYKRVIFKDMYGKKKNIIAKKNTDKAKIMINKLKELNLIEQVVKLRYIDSGPATSGPATSGPAASGPAASGPAASGPAASSSLKYENNILYTNDIISCIMALHFLDKSVFYIPENFNVRNFKEIEIEINKISYKNNNNQIPSPVELIGAINNGDLKAPRFDPKSPIFLSSNSIVLKKIINMSSSLEDFNKNFISCAYFIQFIRCKLFDTSSIKYLESPKYIDDNTFPDIYRKMKMNIYKKKNVIIKENLQLKALLSSDPIYKKKSGMNHTI